MKFPYEDIVNLEHYHDPARPYMPNAERAAQFMPFKSLNEYEDYIDKATDELAEQEDPDYIIDYDTDFLI